MFGVMIVKLGKTPYRWIKPMHLLVTPQEWRKNMISWFHAGTFPNGLMQHLFDTYPDRDQRHCEIEWVECSSNIAAVRNTFQIVDEYMNEPSHDLRHIVNLADLIHVPGSVRFPNEDVVSGDSIFLILKEYNWWTDYGTFKVDISKGVSQPLMINTPYRDY